MDDLAEQILARFEACADEIAEEIAASSVAEVDEFRGVDDALLHGEIRALARRHLDAFLESVRSRTPPSEAMLAAARKRAVQRAREMVPLAALVHSYLIAQRVISAAIAHEAGTDARSRDAAQALTAKTFDYNIAVTATMAEAYLEVVQEDPAELDSARRGFIEGLLTNDPERHSLNSLVQWALLGLLIEHPSYGYELAHRFERTYGGILRLSGASYVDTALRELKRRALIEEGEVSDNRRLPRMRYRATARGVAAYQERLLTQMRENDRRARLLARQLAVLVPEPELALAIIDLYERECLEEAEEGPAVLAQMASGAAPSELAAGALAAEERRLSLDAKLAWVEYARRQLKALSRAPSARP